MSDYLKRCDVETGKLNFDSGGSESDAHDESDGSMSETDHAYRNLADVEPVLVDTSDAESNLTDDSETSDGELVLSSVRASVVQASASRRRATRVRRLGEKRARCEIESPVEESDSGPDIETGDEDEYDDDSEGYQSDAESGVQSLGDKFEFEFKSLFMGMFQSVNFDTAIVSTPDSRDKLESDIQDVLTSRSVNSFLCAYGAAGVLQYGNRVNDGDRRLVLTSTPKLGRIVQLKTNSTISLGYVCDKRNVTERQCEACGKSNHAVLLMYKTGAGSEHRIGSNCANRLIAAAGLFGCLHRNLKHQILTGSYSAASVLPEFQCHLTICQLAAGLQ